MESPLTLLLLLLTLLFMLRYAATHHWLDYARRPPVRRALDVRQGLRHRRPVVATALMLNINVSPSNWRTNGRYWLLRAAPFVPMALGYLAIRLAVIGSLPSGAASYAPQLSPDVLARKAVVLLLTLPNVSPVDNGTTGAMGLGALIGPYVTVAARSVSVLDGLLAVAFLSSPSAPPYSPARQTGAGSCPRLDRRLLGPHAPRPQRADVLPIRSPGGRRRLARHVPRRRPAPPRRAWLAAIVVIAANGLVSNYRSLYYWQQTANAAETVAQTVLQNYASQPLDAITFVTAAPARWQFALTADGKGPLAPRHPEPPTPSKSTSSPPTPPPHRPQPPTAPTSSSTSTTASSPSPRDPARPRRP